MSFLISVAAFVVAIGVLVTVHEYGHFWVARRLGVKVKRFSVGFGRPLWKRVAGPDRTEYVLAAVPLGGYVKMLDEREEDVAPEERHRAFNNRPVGHRIAIVVAGPAANFLFAILAYSMMYWVGIDGVRPYVGVVEPGTHAERAGLQERDLLLAVGDESVRTWDEARLAMLDQGIDATALTLSVQTDDGQRIERTLDLADTRILKEEGDFLQALGVAPWRPFTPIIAEVQPGGAAEQAGLLDGDIVRRVDGERTLSLDAFIAQLRASPERELTLTVERDGALLERSLIPASRIDDGRRVGFINARLSGEMPEALRDQLRTTVAYGPLEGLQRGAVKTWDMTVLTLRVLARLVTGEANVKNISGPIGIAEFAGVSAVIGLAYFLGFLAIVSISLGVLNLLPIPILDGGHLLYYLVEWVKGSPVSEATQAFGQRIGLAMLGALMVLALYNDVTRLLD